MRGIAKSEARRREREGKIGEQVQLEKLKERERSKKDTQERL
jgi:rRNA-processing protein EBP2